MPPLSRPPRVISSHPQIKPGDEFLDLDVRHHPEFRPVLRVLWLEEVHRGRMNGVYAVCRRNQSRVRVRPDRLLNALSYMRVRGMIEPPSSHVRVGPNKENPV